MTTIPVNEAKDDLKDEIIDNTDITDRYALWLLIAGTEVVDKKYTKSCHDRIRKSGDGNYKTTVTADIKHMKKRISENRHFSLYKSLKNFTKLKKETVLKHISIAISEAWNKKQAACIYYSGIHS